MAHILIVDDSGVARGVVADYLTRHGFEVCTAADGRDGLERLREMGRLKVVADHGLVDDALNAVTRQAFLNSGRL